MAHRRFGAFYARSFERRPWLTLAVANGTLGAIADTLAQTFERYQRPAKSSHYSIAKSDESQLSSSTGLSLPKIQRDEDIWDVARTSRFLAFGVIMAPLLAEWNRFIEYRFPLRTVGAAGSMAKVSFGALAKRVSVDQLGL